jgi:hypothetical protein
MQGLVEHSLPCRLSADLAGPKHVLAAGRRLGWNSKPMATASVPQDRKIVDKQQL